ncbi:hypothetical protein SAMN05216229_104277 [Geopseudomonas sagittaria]|uniref:Uncharacterized protein n=1 Tax=Geopseudomonas sagittaria TaxID=1135990 RepID=A0A1I5SAK0_9GAMM|nr:hypothetical protein [Pseudomonas sagittaria]SFP67740.1 hypothetical protein SAMN05216229_104277 [Pseudomonas sagittaria]
MKYEIHTQGKLVFTQENHALRKGFSEYECLIPNSVNLDKLDALCRNLQILAYGARVSSIPQFVKIIKDILNYLRENCLDIPDGQGWDGFIYDFFCFYLTDDKYSKAAINTRQSAWCMYSLYFDQLKISGIVPSETNIPAAKIREIKSDAERSKGYTLGEFVEAVGSDQFHSSIGKNNYLIDLSFALNKDEQLAEIERRLKKYSDVVRDAVLAYWNDMRGAHLAGRKLISKIPKGDIENVVKTRSYYVKINGEWCHLASMRNPDGLAWFLSAVNYFFTETDLLDVVSVGNISKIDFFSGVFKRKSLIHELVDGLRGISNSPLMNEVEITEVIARHLGLLSARDCAAACVLLAGEHPNFTADSISKAALLSYKDKNYIYSGFNNKNLIFGVTKPRATSRKVAILSPISVMVLEGVVEATAELRRKLKAKDHGGSRSLFIISSRVGVGQPNNILIKINAGKGPSLYSSIERNLDGLDIPPATFTISRVRNTKGILKWFETGSIREMSVSLGNTERIVIKHYMPPWILRKANERLVRRFQQKLIIIAAKDSPWLLEASDFSQHSDLLNYVTKLLEITNKGDPVSDAFLSRWADRHEDEYVGGVGGELMVNLSPNSLSLLYAYSEWCSKNLSDEDLETKNITVGISPKALVDLSSLIKAAATGEDVSGVELIVRTKVQGDSHRSLKSMHSIAVSLAKKYLQRLDSMHI